MHETYLSSVRAWLLLPTLLYVTPLSLAAHDDGEGQYGRTPRRTILTIVGGLAGAASGLFFDRQSSGRHCGSCYIGGGAFIGAVAGLLIGRALDQMYAMRYRGASRLRIPFFEQTLDGDPLALTARGTLLAVATSTGVTILSSTDVLRLRARRADEIRGISALDLTSRTHALAVAATPTGLYGYPPIRGPGVLLREGTIQAASAADDRVFFSIGPRIEWVPARADSARLWPGVDTHAPVVDLEWGNRRQILWAFTDTVVALQWHGDSLRMSSRTRVNAGGRSLTAQGDRLGVALGATGSHSSISPITPHRESLRVGLARASYTRPRLRATACTPAPGQRAYSSSMRRRYRCVRSVSRSTWASRPPSCHVTDIHTFSTGAHRRCAESLPRRPGET